jgi:hypothetical protein
VEATRDSRTVDVVGVFIVLLAIVFGIGVGLTSYELTRPYSDHANVIGILTGVGAFGLSFGVAVTFMLLADVVTLLRRRAD